jgi:hypothetical protein
MMRYYYPMLGHLAVGAVSVVARVTDDPISSQGWGAPLDSGLLDVDVNDHMRRASDE